MQRHHLVMENQPTSGLLIILNSFKFLIISNLIISKIVLFRIRRLRLEDGGLFHHFTICRAGQLNSKNSECFLRFGGIMIVVGGGMCQQRQMSQGFGNNRMEGWMFCRDVSDHVPIPLFYQEEFTLL